MTDPLTPAQRKQLLAETGLTEDMLTAAPVKVKVQHVHSPERVPAKTDEPQTIEQVVLGILNASHGNKDAAIAAVRKHRVDEFDRLKLSKLQAAAQGLTVEQKSEHNSNLHAELGRVEQSMLTLVRKHFRENGGFVKAKVTRTTARPQSNPELDAFLLQNQDNEVLRTYLALQTQA